MNRFSLLLLTTLLCPLILHAQEWRPLGPWGGICKPLVKDSATGSYLAGVHPRIWRYGEEEGWYPLINIYDLEVPASVSRMIASPEGIYMLADTRYLYFTEDAGETWSLHYSFPKNWNLYHHFAVIGNRLYTHSNTRDLLASDDRGVTWTRVDSVPSPTQGFATDGDILYVTSGIGLFRRNDGGGWSRIGPRSLFNGRIWPSGDTIVYWDGMGYLYRTFNGGGEWIELADSTADYLAYHNGMIWKVDSGLYSMPLDGESWTRRADYGDHTMYGVDFLSDGSALIIGDALGIRRWDDATGRVSPFDAGVNGTGANILRLSGDTILAAVTYGLAYSDDGGGEWEQWRGPLLGVIDRLVATDDRLYAVEYTGGVAPLYISDDAGRSWRQSHVDSARGFRIGAVHAVGDTVVVGGRGFYRSVDRGETWEQNAMVPSPYVPNYFVGKGSTIFGVQVGPSSILFRSTDAGLTWDSIPQPVPTRLLGYDGRSLYEGNPPNGLRRSTDRGESWQTMSGPFPTYFDGTDSIVAPSFVSAYGDTLFVGFTDQLYGPTRSVLVTTDGGASWKPFNGPHQSSVHAVAIDGDRLVTSSERGFHVTTHPLGVPASRVARGNDLHLAIDGGGRVTWRSAGVGDYRIDLYTLTGEHVALIADGEAAGGTHALMLDDLPAGAYLCTVRTEEGAAGIIIMSE